MPTLLSPYLDHIKSTHDLRAGVSNCEGIKLTTKSTGSLGALLGMYLASGNLFIGQGYLLT